MIYLRYRMKMGPKARRDAKSFWAWLEKREEWFYSVVGDVYVLENWAAFDDEAAFGQYRAALATLRADEDWEGERVTQEDWWEFLDTALFSDPPAHIGFRRE